MNTSSAPILPSEQVLDLFEKVLGNAVGLAEEAAILLDADRSGRAYALAHLANEESRSGRRSPCGWRSRRRRW